MNKNIYKTKKAAAPVYCTNPACYLRSPVSGSIYSKRTTTNRTYHLVYQAPEVINRKARCVDSICCSQTKVPIPVSHASRCGIYRGSPKYTPTSKTRTLSYTSANNPSCVSADKISSGYSNIKLVPMDLYKLNELKQEIQSQQSSRARSEVSYRDRSASRTEYYLNELQKSINKLERRRYVNRNDGGVTIPSLNLNAQQNTCFYDIKVRDEKNNALAYQVRNPHLSSSGRSSYTSIPLHLTEEEFISNKLNNRSSTPIYQRIQNNLRCSSQQVPSRVDFRNDTNNNNLICSKKSERTDSGLGGVCSSRESFVPLSASSKKLFSSMSRLYFKKDDSRRLSQPSILTNEEENVDDSCIQVEYTPQGSAVTVDVSLMW